MAVTADSVVVELLAKTDGYTAKINGAANDTANAMSKIEQSAAKAEAQVNRSAGQIANGTRNFGRQIADIGAQASGGQSPFLIFAQQAPQLAEALTDMGGKAATVAAFFTGPFGATLLAAGSVLGVLASKALETGEGIDDLVKKLSDQATKAATSAQADRIFASTQAGLAAQIRKTTDALNAENASLRTNAQLRNVQARSEVNQAQARLQAANDRVTAANQRVAQLSGPASSDARLGPARDQARAALVQARQEQAAAQLNQRQASIAVNRSRVFLAAEEAAAEATAAGRISKSYDDRIRAVQREATEAAAAGRQVGKATKDRIAALEREKAAALETAQATTGAAKSSAKAIADATKTVSDLQRLVGNAAGKNRERLEKRLGTARERLSLLQQGYGAGAISAATAGGRGGPSDETLARRAEVERVRGVRNNEAFQNDLEAALKEQIQAVRARTTDIVTLAQYSRDEVASETRKRIQQIDADESAKKYTTEQAEELRQLALGNAVLRLININRDERQKLEDQNTAIARAAVDDQQALLQEQLGATRRLADRRAIEQQLIDLKYQELIDEQKRARTRAIENGDIGGIATANRRIVSLNGQKSAEDAALNERYKGRYQQYRESLSDVDRLRDSIDAVKVDALERVSDALTDATTKALGLKGAFGQVFGELIRIGIQRQLIGPLADALFGKEGGGGGGGGNIIKSVLSLFGRASGGYVPAGGIVRVNEGRSTGVELLRMGSQGGTVIPLGQTAAQPAGTGGNRVFHIQVDARNSVTPAGFADQLSAHILSRAAQMDLDAGKATLKQTPGYLAAAQRFGGPKTI